MYLVFYGLLSWEALIISSHTALKSLTRFFHTIFFNAVSFFAPSLSSSPIYFFFSHSHSPSISLSHSPRLSLGRPPFRQRGVCQVPNPWAERSKADKETGDLLFYSGKAKNGIPHRPGHRILPPFSPPAALSLIQSSSLALVFFSLLSVFPPAPSPSLLSQSWSTFGGKGATRVEGEGLWELMSSFVRVAGILLAELVARREGRGKRAPLSKTKPVDAAICKKNRSAQKLMIQW